MGTGLWADVQCDSEPDQLQVTLPISLLSCEPITCRALPEKHLSGMLSKVDTGAWESWDEELSSPDPLMCLPTVELSVQAEIRLDNFRTSVSVLIDTGSRIPLLLRQNLIPDDYLIPAKRVIRILTADNSPMDGGDTGCNLMLLLPILPGKLNSRAGYLRCHPVWGYVADVQGSDVVLGYPFLKFFSLVVDCPSDGLRCIPISTRHTLVNNYAETTTSTTRSTQTPCRTLSTPCSTATPCSTMGRLNSNPEADDANTVTNGTQRLVSKSPYNLPGKKAKDANSKVNSAPSSRPASSQHRNLTDAPSAGSPMTLPVSRVSPPLPTDANSAQSSDAHPPTPQPFRGDGASFTNYPSATTLFQCTNCS